MKVLFEKLAALFSHIYFLMGKPFSKEKTNSITFQISILYTAILGFILVVLSGVLFIILSNTLYTEPDYKLKQKAQEISQTIRTYMDIHGNDPQALKPAVRQVIAPETIKPSGWFAGGSKRRWLERLDKLDISRDLINFASFDKVSIVHSQNVTDDLLAIFKENMLYPEKPPYISSTITYSDKKLRLINYPFISQEGHKYIIQVAIPPDPTAVLLQDWMYSMLVGIPLVLLLTSFFGRVMARRMLRPVNAITRAAQQITHEDLSSRVPSEEFAVEMSGLVDAFNDMIGRLQKSFKHIEDFSSQVAHELKTPLSIIKGESELALRRERDAEDYKRAIGTTLEESERMLKIINDLLLLTKVDYQPEVFRYKEIDCAGFLREIYEHTKFLAIDKGIHVDLNMPQERIMINADALHLRRLFFNLTDNAIKATPAGGTITIRVQCSTTTLTVSVTDTGKGIADYNLPHIFDKFSRLDTHEQGTGLGLNIAQSIAKLHKGHIKVQSKIGEGSTFEVNLPLISYLEKAAIQNHGAEETVKISSRK